MKVLPIILCALLFVVGVGACSSDEEAPLRVVTFSPDEVAETLKRVGQWQLEHPVGRISTTPLIWERGVFYAALMAVHQATGDSFYFEEVRRWSANQQYQLANPVRHADNQAVGQAYVALYDSLRQPEMIREVERACGAIVSESHQGRVLWDWCDALFMAPPVFAHLSAVTEDTTYVATMDELWWDVYDFLYDPTEGLFYRDANYVDVRNDNGKKVFWSRGNGWVIAGIVRVLDHLSPDDPRRDRYVALLQKMATALVPLQRADGLWSPSLLDPNSYPLPETSGTGFFVYSMAWGVRQGYLDGETFLPVIRRGWEGLIRSTSREGRLGWVQQPWHAPGPVYEDGSQEYGTAAFLLAGSEVYQLVLTSQL